MKRCMMIVGATVLLFAMIQIGGWAQEKYIPTPDEELYGTWVNEQMNPPKTLNNPDGTFADYFPATYSKPFRGGTTEIFKKWTDSEGSVFYDTYTTFTFGSGMVGWKIQNLTKISKSGTVLENNWVGVSDFGPEKFPSKIDNMKGGPGAVEGYFIYYRAQK